MKEGKEGKEGESYRRLTCKETEMMRQNGRRRRRKRLTG